MVRLVPMTPEEFEAFMVISMRDQAQGQVQAGAWLPEESGENIHRLRSQFLPGGLATPGQCFFIVQEASTGIKVGGLWYLVQEEEGRRELFVVDIQIGPAYRRRGYASAAFKAMEEQVREAGIDTISLHVFEHNRPARAMYEKLGYTGTGTMMSKALRPPP
jgi:RimJ/RimL family protein N-acetyltransferase